VFDTSLITPAYPDYDLIRRIVRDALAPPPPATDDAPAPSPEAPEQTPPLPGNAEGDVQPVTDVGDACAYDPVQAQEALAAGEPPSRAG
jgi:polyisoprenyl-teichoic acid--peptidoglycan teichoic acid transferase